MSYINESDAEIQLIHDESIIHKYSEFKMHEHPTTLIRECEAYLKDLNESNCTLTNDNILNTSIITGIIKYYKNSGKLSIKQQKCLCNFIAYESFFDIGPKQMLEQISLYDNT